MAIEGTGYIKREEFALFADVGAEPTLEWELIGDKVEEMSLAMNPNVETVNDVTGVTSVTLDKYAKQTDVAPFRAKRSSQLAAWLYDVVKNEKTLSDVVKKFLVVNKFDATTSGEPAVTTYAAWTQDAVVAVQSYGGNTQGLDIPFNLHWTGGKIYGQFNPATSTFTPDE